MRLLAVEQLRKTENDALEVNFASFSLCLHWWTFFLSCLAHSCDLRANPVTCLQVALPGGCLSRVVASIHLITVDAGLQLGCCRADAGLLLNGCGISPLAACKLLLRCCQTASRLLLETCCRAGGKLLLQLRGFQSCFLASFGPVRQLVGGLEHFLFFHILEIVLPTDFHIFQRSWNYQPDMFGTGYFVWPIRPPLDRRFRRQDWPSHPVQLRCSEKRGRSEGWCLGYKWVWSRKISIVYDYKSWL